MIIQGSHRCWSQSCLRHFSILLFFIVFSSWWACGDGSLEFESGVSEGSNAPEAPKRLELPRSPGKFGQRGAEETGDKDSLHPGYVSALLTSRLSTSNKNAYILLMGGRNSGKEEFVQGLFSRGDSPYPSSVQGPTRLIQEFVVSVPLSQPSPRGVADRALRIVDIPEFQREDDEEGPYENAEILAGLEAFINGHSELRHRRPNAVFFFNRYEYFSLQSGHRQVFTLEPRTTQLIELFDQVPLFRQRFLDPDLKNLFVISSPSFNSLTLPVTRTVSLTRDGPLKTIESAILGILKDRWNFNIQGEQLTCFPIQGAGNNLSNLKSNTNFQSKLENALRSMLDTLGLYIIPPFFQAIAKTDLIYTVYTMRIQDWDRHRYIQYLKVLSGSDRGFAPGPDTSDSKLSPKMDLYRFSSPHTEISRILHRTFVQDFSRELQHKHVGELKLLQNFFHMQSITKPAHLPDASDRKALVNFFRAFHCSDFNMDMLRLAFNLEMPEPPPHFLSMNVGHGYNVVKDCMLNSLIVAFGPLKPTSLGFQLPEGIQVTHNIHGSNVVSQLDFYESKLEFLQRKLERLHLKLNSNSFSGSKIQENLKVPPGVNILEERSNTNLTTYSGGQELRLFQLSLEDNIQLRQHFVNLASKLPPFALDQNNSVETWRVFFDTWGTHLLTSAYGGGKIQIDAQLSKNSNNNNNGAEELETLFQNSVSLPKVMRTISESLNSGREFWSVVDTTSTKNGSQDFVDFRIVLLDGSSDDPKEFQEINSTSLKTWSEISQIFPIRLDTGETLTPIPVILDLISTDLGLEARKAFQAYLNDQLVYIPPINIEDQNQVRFEAQMTALNEMSRNVSEQIKAMSSLVLEEKSNQLQLIQQLIHEFMVNKSAVDQIQVQQLTDSLSTEQEKFNRETMQLLHNHENWTQVELTRQKSSMDNHQTAMLQVLEQESNSLQNHAQAFLDMLDNKTSLHINESFDLPHNFVNLTHAQLATMDRRHANQTAMLDQRMVTEETVREKYLQQWTKLLEEDKNQSLVAHDKLLENSENVSELMVSRQDTNFAEFGQLMKREADMGRQESQKFMDNLGGLAVEFQRQIQAQLEDHGNMTHGQLSLMDNRHSNQTLHLEKLFEEEAELRKKHDKSVRETAAQNLDKLQSSLQKLVEDFASMSSSLDSRHENQTNWLEGFLKRGAEVSRNQSTNFIDTVTKQGEEFYKDILHQLLTHGNRTGEQLDRMDSRHDNQTISVQLLLKEDSARRENSSKTLLNTMDAGNLKFQADSQQIVDIMANLTEILNARHAAQKIELDRIHVEEAESRLRESQELMKRLASERTTFYRQLEAALNSYGNLTAGQLQLLEGRHGNQSAEVVQLLIKEGQGRKAELEAFLNKVSAEKIEQNLEMAQVLKVVRNLTDNLEARYSRQRDEFDRFLQGQLNTSQHYTRALKDEMMKDRGAFNEEMRTAVGNLQKAVMDGETSLRSIVHNMTQERARFDDLSVAKDASAAKEREEDRKLLQSLMTNVQDLIKAVGTNAARELLNHITEARKDDRALISQLWEIVKTRNQG